MDLTAEKELMCKYLDPEIVNSENLKYLFVNDLEKEYQLVKHKEIIFVSTYMSTKNTFLHKCVCLTKTYPQINEFLKEYLKTCQIINEQNSRGCTALILSVISSNYSSSEETVQILIDAGADVNLHSNFGWTPLHFATYQSQTTSSINTMSILIKAGGNINALTHERSTCLDYTLDKFRAKGYYKTNEMIMLLEAGADIVLCKNKALAVKNPVLNKILIKKVNDSILTKDDCIICYLEDCNVLKCKFDHGICKECFMEQMNFDCLYCKNPISFNQQIDKSTN